MTIQDCCNHSKKAKQCKRKSDGKKFKLPRRFSKSKCKNPKGFTMRSSCAPYKDCKKKPQFLFNPNDPKNSFDVYIDKNPKDTIPIKYTTLKDVENTIKKLERLYRQKKYTHKRIWQVGMILYVRLKVIKQKKMPHYRLAHRYFLFLGRRSKIKNKNKFKEFLERKKLKFIIKK